MLVDQSQLFTTCDEMKVDELRHERRFSVHQTQLSIRKLIVLVLWLAG